MTREEAIKILEQQFDKSCGNYRYQNAQKLDYEDALWMAISALHTQQEREKNNPLTMDELLKMDGAPVWQVDPGRYTGWALVRVWSKNERVVYVTYNNGLSNLVKVLLEEEICGIYRRKPEKSANGTNVLTNADRIRAMTDEKLAKFLIEVHQGLLVKNDVLNVKYWLQQPAEER